MKLTIEQINRYYIMACITSINWKEHGIDNEDLTVCSMANELYKNLRGHERNLLDGSIGPICLPFSSSDTGFLFKPIENTSSFKIYIWNGPSMVKTNEIRLQKDFSFVKMIATIALGLKESKQCYNSTLNNALMTKLNTDKSPKVVSLCMLSGQEVAVHAVDYFGKLDSTSPEAINIILMYGEIMHKSEKLLFSLFKHLLENNNKCPKNIF